MASTNRPDRAVQRFVGAAHRFNPVDGVQYRSVMPAAKLAANFLKCCPCELSRDEHRYLAWKDVGAPIGAHLELGVAHLALIEVFAHSPADCLDRYPQWLGIRDRCCWRTRFGIFVVGVLGCVVPDDGTQPDERHQPVLSALIFRPPEPCLGPSLLGSLDQDCTHLVRDPRVVQPVPSYGAHRDTVAHQGNDNF